MQKLYRACVALTLTLATALSLQAQTSPELIVKPFAEGETFELSTSSSFQEGEIENNGRDLDITTFRSKGRYLLNGDSERPIALGYSVTYFDLDTDDPRLPERLGNHAAAIGAALGEAKGWRLHGTAGIGFASDNAYSDSDGLYGTLNLLGTKRISETEMMTLAVSYDGNRAFMPDVPLPGFVYTNMSNRDFVWSLGVPLSSLKWRPSDRISVEAAASLFAFTRGGAVKATYKATDNIDLFAMATSTNEAFSTKGARDNRRLFFEQSKAELGVDWHLSESVTLTAAGGQAFDQEFRTGWDTRDTNGLRDLEDETYFRVAASLSF